MKVQGILLTAIAVLGTAAILRNSRVTVTSVTAGVEPSEKPGHCQETLDKLDETWDLRRDARRAYTQNMREPVKRAQSTGVFDFWEPEAVCLDMERFGGPTGERYVAFGDGPKVVCGVDRIVEKGDDCLIYSVGSNNEMDFEVSVQATMKGQCEVHTFDPTIKPDLFKGHNFTKFHDWGFGMEGKHTKITHKTRGFFDFTEISIRTAMKRLGHEDRVIDVFKIDCDGCEYVALKEAFEAIAAGAIRIDQVQVELHGGYSTGTFPLIKTLIAAADEAEMLVFYKEPNGWGCKGYGCIEYAFVSKDYLRKANRHYVCGGDAASTM